MDQNLFVCNYRAYFPIDNDDGSNAYVQTRNFLLWGGAKNLMGCESIETISRPHPHQRILTVTATNRAHCDPHNRPTQITRPSSATTSSTSTTRP